VDAVLRVAQAVTVRPGSARPAAAHVPGGAAPERFLVHRAVASLTAGPPPATRTGRSWT